MRLHLPSFLAASVAVLFSVSAASAADAWPRVEPCSDNVPDGPAWHAAATSMPAGELVGQTVVVNIDLDAGPGFGVDGRQLHYGMLFNDVPESWSWQPQARSGEEDFYRWKFFPLGSSVEEQPPYRQEEKIGEMQDTRVQSRFEYFFAFDNPYDFYVRNGGDRTGFTVRLPAGMPVPGQKLRLHAVGTLGDPALAESTTYWKAIYARPVDFTLKKRYLIGFLETIVVCGDDGEIARIRPLPPGGKRQR